MMPAAVRVPAAFVTRVALGALACLASCAKPKVELAVYAAASTRDALLAIEPLYERDHAVDLVFNFGSSGDLARQIRAAGKADLFLSADEQAMDELALSGLVGPDMRRDLLTNQLAVIEPVDPLDPQAGARATSFELPFTASQLASPRVRRLSLANVASVPAGRYAKAWLERQDVWSGVAGKVLPAIDVRAALAAVESGAAQAGVVYRTDAVRSTKVRIVFDVPASDAPPIRYPLVVMSTRPHVAEARELAEFLTSAAAGSVFASFGFGVLDPRDPHAK
jgi:molybdate transport system substrate-binding protein